MARGSRPKDGQFWTLTFLVEGDKVWLAEHARGPAKGLLNGYGGKGRSFPRLVALRELYEESRCIPLRSERRAVFDFYFEGTHVPGYIDVVTRWIGTPRATEEMTDPRLYDISDLPYERMWPSNRHWLERVLKGEKLEGEIHTTAGECTDYDIRPKAS